MAAVFAINILEYMSSEAWDKLYDQLSEERKTKLNRYHFDIDKKRCLLAENLVTYALRNECDLKRDEIVYSIDEYGKPELYGKKEVYFNLSHSGEWVVCIVGHQRVGIDVEVVANIAESMYKSVFTLKEIEVFITNNDNKEEGVIQLWTLKESYVKAIGKGMSLPFTSIEFCNNFNGVIQVSCDDVQEEQYSFACIKLDNNHMLSICTKSDEILEGPLAIKYVTNKDLLALLPQ